MNRWMPLIFLCFSFSLSAAYASRCDEVARSLLQKMVQKNIPEQRVRTIVHFEEKGKSFEYQIFFYDESHFVGDIEIKNIKNPKIAEIALMRIRDSQYEGRGLGSYIYMMAAKDVYEKTGLLLQKSGSTSTKARAVWAQLTEKGLVRQDQFTVEALKSEEVQKMYERFLKNRRRR